ncbi:hypothetical protein [Flavobacterium sp. FlaQc-28]|uniref:hypothetical protein n=1 Tax=Flavobacterium sp. FlaQc-28 TaxID=3374178 RepID=UPI003757A3F2
METPILTSNLNLFADYFQIYLEDENNGKNLADSWTDDAVKILLAVTETTIGIGTVRNMYVPVILNIFDSEPIFKNDINDINQINECDIEITSGSMVIAGCTDYYPEAKRIKLANAIYRLRIYYGNLEKLSDNGLEGEDFYIIEMWKVKEKTETKIIKQRDCY